MFRFGICPYRAAGYIYGCYISGAPQTFLALTDSGAVTQIWLEDSFIGR